MPGALNASCIVPSCSASAVATLRRAFHTGSALDNGQHHAWLELHSAGETAQADSVGDSAGWQDFATVSCDSCCSVCCALHCAPEEHAAQDAAAAKKCS